MLYENYTFPNLKFLQSNCDIKFNKNIVDQVRL